MTKAVIICGPTAVGKTDCAFSLTSHFPAEIVSADSRQIYKEFSILTGKDIPSGYTYDEKALYRDNHYIGAYRGNTTVWMTDRVHIDEQYTVYQYVRDVGYVVADIEQRGKFPIVVGGTGFYIQALVSPPESLGVPTDTVLREKLHTLSVDELMHYLQRIAPDKYEHMNNSDRHNPRRLIRAIEVAKYGLPTEIVPPVLATADVLVIGLQASQKDLRERIALRVHARWEKAYEEVQTYLKDHRDNKVSPQILGFEPIAMCITGHMTKEEAISQWTRDEIHYMRRQYTWFTKQLGVIWVDITKQSWQENVVERVEAWYTRH